VEFPTAYTANKKLINVIIETPCKSHNKFDYDNETGLFKLKKIMPPGLFFPCDMGFIPNTKGEDGEPLDALVLMDEYTYPGCLIECRLLGVIEATQKERKSISFRNDRFVFVPPQIQEPVYLKNILNLNESKLRSIITFFQTYNAFEDKIFKVEKISGVKKAHQLIKKQLVKKQA